MSKDIRRSRVALITHDVELNIKKLASPVLSEKLRTRPFYRMYPYSGGVLHPSVDRRGLIDFEIGVFFSRIPKAANSSVIINLAETRFGKSIASPQAKKLFLFPSQISEPQALSVSTLFRFTFVRDPYSRILSAYLDKIVRGKTIPSELRRRSGLYPTFEDFCRYLSDGGLYDNIHWAPQTTLLHLPIDQYDFIGKTENFDADIRTVFASIDRKLPVVRSQRGHATGANDKIDQHYTTDSKHIVEDLFKEDFINFEYPLLKM